MTRASEQRLRALAGGCGWTVEERPDPSPYDVERTMKRAFLKLHRTPWRAKWSEVVDDEIAHDEARAK